MAEQTAVLWRCRECGKWSHAKRDPIAHKRWHHVEGEPAWRGWFVWCGPFDRWEARHSDPNSRPKLPHLGEPVSPMEREVALHPVPDDSPVPF
jgi:hypothetical protein